MGRDKRQTIHKFKTKLSIPSKLVLCDTYKQATQLTLTEGLVSRTDMTTFFQKKRQLSHLNYEKKKKKLEEVSQSLCGF